MKARLFCAVMDLPAKASLLNCIQFNGTYGCSTCKHPGSTVCGIIVRVFVILLHRQVSVGRGKAHAYKFDYDYQLRNHQDHLADAQKALDSHSVLFKYALFLAICIFFRLLTVLKDIHHYTFCLLLM